MYVAEEEEERIDEEEIVVDVDVVRLREIGIPRLEPN